jgi:hypothetical protein
LLPQPHADGTPIQPSELSQSLPGYLIRLIPELGVEGQLVAAGPAFTMGSELIQSASYFNAATGQWEGGEENRSIVGEYNATALNLQGVSQSQIAKLRTRLQATKARLDQFQLNTSDLTPLQSLTKEDLSGDLLYSGILGYFNEIDANDTFSLRANGRIVAYRLPSYGRFFAMAQPHFFFGIVRTVNFPGLAMDVDFVRVQTEAKNEDKAVRLSFMREIGAAGSSAEHAVPEQFFRDPSKPANDPTQQQAVSAVKALTIASSQGQRIYTLNSQNQTIHASTLASLGISAEAKAEIANALAAGREVTVHQTNINSFGFSGAGYIIIDPETGAGAYKIEGGANGAIFTTWLAFVAVGLAIAAAFAAGFVFAPFAALFLLAANILLLVLFNINQSSTDQQLMDAHVFATLAAILSLAALLFLLAGAGAVVAAILIMGAIWLALFRFTL